ncbi:MAG: Sua5/YciO/YrdC/YwlC family protein [Lachnoclostridium sp.]|nr:Sua5/YciO/YrdC/YwlC family protein [Lachnoclostridium sp.]
MTFTDDLHLAVDTMRKGGIILYPTDTVWGIGCDATCHEAIRRIFALKRRDDAKAMISLVGSMEMLREVASEVSDDVMELIEDERPTTVIFHDVKLLDPALRSADGSAAIRLTREKYSAGLCLRLGRPVVSTSANISGMPPAATYEAIDPAIVNGVDYAASYRRDDHSESQPSRIIMVMPDKSLKVIRE